MNEPLIVVIGAGHAGCEAASAAARCGAQVVLISNRVDDAGAMSCNPSIGGIGKGHMVREIDVFDGLIARAADDAAIHYRMLNHTKGSAVQGPRVQADRMLYRKSILRQLAQTERLSLVAGHVDRLILQGGRIGGVCLKDGTRINAAAVILATGTFLGGRLLCGCEQTAGGRADQPAAETLARQLRDLALPMGRLKTGTPPRLDGRTIDWAALQAQPSDAEQWTFSPMTSARPAPQLSCAITRTNPRSHDIVRRALPTSPTYSGMIEGRGPRYCPSIEDKIIRFGDRDGHQVFLEPEGIATSVIYPNGISTSLPEVVQQDLVHSIAGMAQAKIVRFGYAVEYDFIDPRALDHSLALRAVEGLYLAGQINGTTGYEEAAAQGLVAGLNAAAAVAGTAAIIFDRSSSYIGVMIDDLTLQGVTEPYRMLTARAEYRLTLRADNAATRLGKAALKSGAVGDCRRRWLEQRYETVEQARRMISRGREAEALALGDAGSEAIEDVRYAPYVERQEEEIARLRKAGSESLATIQTYRDITGLSGEMIERLEAARPANLAEAGRVRGVTPAALTTVLFVARRRAA